MSDQKKNAVDLIRARLSVPTPTDYRQAWAIHDDGEPDLKNRFREIWGEIAVAVGLAERERYPFADPPPGCPHPISNGDAGALLYRSKASVSAYRNEGSARPLPDDVLLLAEYILRDVLVSPHLATIIETIQDIEDLVSMRVFDAIAPEPRRRITLFLERLIAAKDFIEALSPDYVAEADAKTVAVDAPVVIEILAAKTFRTSTVLRSVRDILDIFERVVWPVDVEGEDLEDAAEHLFGSLRDFPLKTLHGARVGAVAAVNIERAA